MQPLRFVPFFKTKVTIDIISCDEAASRNLGLSIWRGDSCSSLECHDSLSINNENTATTLVEYQGKDCTSSTMGKFMAEDGVSYKMMLYSTVESNWEEIPSWSVSVSLV